jgi:predicted nucleic acid-binding protein
VQGHSKKEKARKRAMVKPILMDTDVMVDFLRGHAAAVALVRQCSDRIILSAIVVADLYAGVKGDEELGVLNDLVSLFHTVPVSHALAKTAGLYRRDYAKSHGVGLGDAILAATAEAEAAELKTLNVKHYPMLKKLKPAYAKK